MLATASATPSSASRLPANPLFLALAHHGRALALRVCLRCSSPRRWSLKSRLDRWRGPRCLCCR
eukprot:6686898-Pyramimonas_sp.AAC.1